MPLSGEKTCCFQLFSLTFDWIFVKVAGNKDRHKSSNEFEFGPSLWSYLFLRAEIFTHRLIMEKMMSPFFLSYYEFSLHLTYR